MSEKEYECYDCGWVGSTDNMDGVTIKGLPSMPRVVETSATTVPSAATLSAP
ncbi:hypothetical protein HVTV-2_gp85 [Haloarcula virus HVTV-2]|uniref:Uncharacterized protein n=1 Tax=Haloarcula vallismortis tailed virus 1 TaxID=1262528 RepID=L7TGW7_9CAUD|nr:hypothetical protein HVTV1_85 [Haloarcula vallismortis tailed virus 1]AGC34454.1 hypothetical protein HVTV1_85 [Haloarcula vallismortis tailed virus 1]UBF22892.1 hypothetical protein HVTV-2_gp85 [Haloarcula virus HVTV-2]